MGPRVLAWGTWDDTKPRVRLMLEALRRGGLPVDEVHADVWSGVVDKSQLRGARALLGTAAKWAASYARLLDGLVRKGAAADIVFVGYLGQLDVLMAWPIAKLRGEPIVWDAFISLYDTVVDDRKMVSPTHPIARALWAWEWLACRAADVVVLDTEAHATWFRSTFDLPRDRTGVVFVGAEADAFAAVEAVAVDEDAADDDVVTVMFYGQFIPLHGIATIVEAARRSDTARVKWVLIGSGQETAKIKAMLDEQPLENLTWIPWVEYPELRAQIAAADICLGIFGDSDKAGRVIPNKVFQILSVGKPLITRDSAGIRELVDDDDAGIYLVPAADPDAINAAIERFRAERRALPKALHARLTERFSPQAQATALRDLMTKAGERRR